MNKRILVIDDDPTLLKLTQGVLTSNGFEVTAVNDAPNGLETAMKQKPDLIVLDVMMPIINGFNICRLLKSQKTHKHIPIILLTSRASQADQDIGSEVGANAYLAKPFKTEELLGKIRELLKVT
jgi:DNA-binding response OmpR family regulator